MVLIAGAGLLWCYGVDSTTIEALYKQRIERTQARKIGPGFFAMK